MNADILRWMLWLNDRNTHRFHLVPEVGLIRRLPTEVLSNPKTKENASVMLLKVWGSLAEDGKDGDNKYDHTDPRNSADWDQLFQLGPAPFTTFPIGETKTFFLPGVVNALTWPLMTIRVHGGCSPTNPWCDLLGEYIVLGKHKYMSR